MNIGLEWLAFVAIVFIAWRFGVWQGYRKGLAGRAYSYHYYRGKS